MSTPKDWVKTDPHGRPGISDSRCNYLATSFCNKCGRQHDGRSTEPWPAATLWPFPPKDKK